MEVVVLLVAMMVLAMAAALSPFLLVAALMFGAVRLFAPYSRQVEYRRAPRLKTPWWVRQWHTDFEWARDELFRAGSMLGGDLTR